MKKNHLKNDTNQFITRLLQSYSEHIRVESEIVDANHTPFFMTRLWASIRQEQQSPQIWELGVISARKWLFALSVVALLFFFGNLVAIRTQSRGLLHPTAQSSLQDMEEGDYVEEALME